MGSWGQSCLLLSVKIVEWSLVLSSSESVQCVCDGKGHGLFDDVLVVGDESSEGVWVLSSGVSCLVLFKKQGV